jgi:hypothetical protein
MQKSSRRAADATQRQHNMPARRRLMRAGTLGIAESRISHALDASLGVLLTVRLTQVQILAQFAILAHEFACQLL